MYYEAMYFELPTFSFTFKSHIRKVFVGSLS